MGEYKIRPYELFLGNCFGWIVCWCLNCVIYIDPGSVATPQAVFHFYGQASRPISTGQLNALLHLHTQPINVVVYNGPLGVVTPRDT